MDEPQEQLPDEQIPAVEGQELSAETPEEGQSSEFRHQYVYPDGETLEFSSLEDLNKHLRESYFRRKDYTQKTQTLAEERKQIEEQRKKFEDEMKQFQDMKRKNDEWDQTLRQRPDVYQQLQRVAQGPITPDALYDRARQYADEKVQSLQQELEEIKKERETQRTEAELNQVFEQLQEQFPDFDRDSVRSLLEELMDGNTEPLIRMLYFAHKGMTNPAEIERRLAEKQKKKQSAGMVPAGDVSPRETSKEFTSVDEARMAALNEIAGGG